MDDKPIIRENCVICNSIHLNDFLVNEYDNVVVICSHMGIYMNEISKNLKSIRFLIIFY
jgi:hypothetical protein